MNPKTLDLLFGILHGIVSIGSLVGSTLLPFLMNNTVDPKSAQFWIGLGMAAATGMKSIDHLNDYHNASTPAKATTP